MDLCTNAGLVSDALKFVERKKEQLDTLLMIRKDKRNGRGQNHNRSILVNSKSSILNFSIEYSLDISDYNNSA
jgi:hypothetical protein